MSETTKKLLIVGFFMAAFTIYGLKMVESDSDGGHDEKHHHDHGHHGHGHDHHEHDHDHEEILSLTPKQIEDGKITIATVESGGLQRRIQSPGKVTLNENLITHIHPKVSGMVASVNKNLGEKVQVGEPLASLESKEIAEAKMNYRTALKKEELTALLLEQEKQLKSKGLSSLEDYQKALIASEESHMALELAKQQLYAFALTEEEISDLINVPISQLHIHQIKSPFRGSIIQRKIISGESLDPDHEIFVLSDLNYLWVDISLSPQDLDFISKGQKIEIDDGSGKNGLAEIIYISPLIDDETRRARVIAVLENFDEKWHPGTFITASMNTQDTFVPLKIAKTAVQKIDGHECAFVVIPEGFEIREIQTGRFDHQSVEVLSGLEEGESYASNNTFLLKAEHGKEGAQHEH